MKTKVYSAIITMVLIISASFFLYSCGSEDNSSAETTTTMIIEYQKGDLYDDTTYLPPLDESLRQTGGAFIQAILAINTFLFTDNTVTDMATFEARKAQADQALEVLIELAEKTEIYADNVPSTDGSTAYAPIVVDPEEILAVLKSSKIKWPIKTLMQTYQVEAKKAQLLLNNAMAGLTSKYYMDEAAYLTEKILQAQVVRDGCALTFAVGSTIISAGGTAGAMTLVEGTSAVISITDAGLKAGKSGAELMIGKDGALDSTFNNSVIVKGLSDLNEIIAIKNYFVGSKDPLTDASSLVYITGKLSEVLQDKRLTLGAHAIELTPVDVPKVGLDLSVSTEAVFPGEYTILDGSRLIVDYLPVVFIGLLGNLPEESQVEDTKEALIPTMTVDSSEISRDESQIVYSVTATLSKVTDPVTVTITATSAAGTSSATKTITSDDSVIWYLTAFQSDVTVTVTRSDNGETDTFVLPGISHPYTYEDLLVWENYPAAQWCPMTSSESSLVVVQNNLRVLCKYLSTDQLPLPLGGEEPFLDGELSGYIKDYSSSGDLVGCYIYKNGNYVSDCF